MFKIEKYQIVFKKIYINSKARNKGRPNTFCKINRDGEHWIAGCGISRLHPNDNPDKIIGKKIALAKALDKISELSKGYPRSKETRTEIWKAFWNWIESWKTNNNPACFGEPIQESEKCNNCSCLNQCVDKLWNDK